MSIKFSQLYDTVPRYGILLYNTTAGDSDTLVLPDFGQNYFLKITGCSGGGGGGSGSDAIGEHAGGAGGAEGCPVQGFLVEVEGNESIDWSIGEGGAGGSSGAGNAGSDTVVGDLITLPGGVGGRAPAEFGAVLLPGYSMDNSDASKPLPILGQKGIRYGNNQLGRLQDQELAALDQNRNTVPEYNLKGSLVQPYYGGIGQSTEYPFVPGTEGGGWGYHTTPGSASTTTTPEYAGGGGGAASPWGNGGNSTTSGGQDADGYGAGGGAGTGESTGITDGGDGAGGFLLIEYMLEPPVINRYPLYKLLGQA